MGGFWGMRTRRASSRVIFILLIVARRRGRVNSLAGRFRESACPHAGLLPDWRERRSDLRWEQVMFSIGRGDVRLGEAMSRREWLRVGALGAAGLALPELLASQARARPHGSFGRAK